MAKPPIFFYQVMIVSLFCTKSGPLDNHPDSTVKCGRGRSDKSDTYDRTSYLNLQHVLNLGEVPFGRATSTMALEPRPISPRRTGPAPLGWALAGRTIWLNRRSFFTRLVGKMGYRVEAVISDLFPQPTVLYDSCGELCMSGFPLGMWGR